MNANDIIYDLITNTPEECLCVDDSDFLKYFRFNLCDEYIQDVSDYLESEYTLHTIHDFACSTKTLHIEEPLIINFIDNTIEKVIYDPKNKLGNTIFTKLKTGLSIYHPTIIATNSSYVKPIILMLHTKYKDVEGYNYILYRILTWLSGIVPYYTNLKSTSLLYVNTISIPFTYTFISFFFKRQVTFDNSHSFSNCYSQINNTWYKNLKVCPTIKK